MSVSVSLCLSLSLSLSVCMSVCLSVSLSSSSSSSSSSSLLLLLLQNKQNILGGVEVGEWGDSFPMGVSPFLSDSLSPAPLSTPPPPPPLLCLFLSPPQPSGSGDNSVVRAPDSWSKGRGFESLQERRDNFLLHGHLSVLTHILVSVPPPCYNSST